MSDPTTLVDPVKTTNVQPWLLGQGQAKSVMDPTWAVRPWCDGDIEWTGTDKWWRCRKCNYHGTASVPYHHPVVSPTQQFIIDFVVFVVRRVLEGVPMDIALKQAQFVSSTALRYAATLPSDKMGMYVRQLVAT